MLKINWKAIKRGINSKYKLCRGQFDTSMISGIQDELVYDRNYGDISLRPTDVKIKEFQKWYYKNFIKNAKLTDIGKFHESNSIVNFIEKMASWYEMRYLDHVIYPSFNLEPQNNEVNFKEYLSPHEEYYLNIVVYPNFYVLLSQDKTINIKSDGTVAVIDENELTNDFLKEINGKNLLQLKEILIKKGMFEDARKIQEIIDNYQLQIELRERILDCVMYRIIERGGNRIGPRRALLFAKEFNRNQIIPLIYGIDMSDPYLKEFIGYYIDLGIDTNLMCFLDYFSRTSNYSKINTVNLQDVMEQKHIHQNIRRRLER